MRSSTPGLACLSASCLLLASCATSDGGTASAAGASPSQCGYVTASQGLPPEDSDVYGASITQVDGRSTSVGSRDRVTTGIHTLTVSEQIPFNDLSSPQIVQITKMKRREDARAYKPLEVDVQPNTTYRIGARLLRDRLDDASIDANAYWEPVVWETLETNCR